jgi:hypothetical protein
MWWRRKPVEPNPLAHALSAASRELEATKAVRAADARRFEERLATVQKEYFRAVDQRKALEAELEAKSFEAAMVYGKQPGEPRASFLARRELDLDGVRSNPGSKAILNVLLDAENAMADLWLAEKDPAVADRIRMRASVASELRSAILVAMNTKRVREERVQKHEDTLKAEDARFRAESGIDPQT